MDYLTIFIMAFVGFSLWLVFSGALKEKPAEPPNRWELRHREAEQLFKQVDFPSADQFAQMFISHLRAESPKAPHPQILAAILKCVTTIYEYEVPTSVPQISSRNPNDFSGERALVWNDYNYEIEVLLGKIRDPVRTLQRLCDILARVFADFISKLPPALLADWHAPPPAPTAFSISLADDFPAAREAKHCLRLYDPEGKNLALFGLLHKNDPPYAELPTDPAWLKEGMYPGIHAYFISFLRDIASTPIPFDIPFERWFEGTWIVAPTGQGKTNLLKHLILSFPTNAAIILIDAKGELIQEFSRLEVLKERLVLLDPTPECPLAINPLDIGGHSVELLEYLFAALLEAGMTPLQSTLFRLTLTLVVTVPNATLETFRDIIQNGVKPYEQYVRKLSKRDQDFFDKEFNGETYRKTKQEIMWRLRLLFSIPALDAMLQSPKTKLDIGRLMDEGKFVCINNNYELLGDQGSEFFGRFFIALIWAAARKRTQMPANVPKRPVFVLIDEAHYVIARDTKIPTILQQCRAQKVAMVFAHQELQSIKNDDVRVALKNCGIKFAHPDAEAFELAPFFNTDKEFFQSLQEYHFACTIRNKTKTPVSLAVPAIDLEDYPQMSPADFRMVVLNSRIRYCTGEAPPQYDPPEGDTLYHEHTISPILARKGGKFDVPYFAKHGDKEFSYISINIPAGTKDGARFRVKGVGTFRPDGTRGDIIITFHVFQVPRAGQVDLYGAVDNPDPDELG